MKGVIRRLARLEAGLIPKVDAVSLQLVNLLLERRRRRLEASGLFVEEELPSGASMDSRPCLSLAETLRLRRQERTASVAKSASQA